jgi:hypothetical protein
MTAFRLISLPFHGALELAIGLATMVAPFVLGFGAAGTVVGVLVGALIVGLALGAAVSESGTIDITAHYAYDVGLALGLLGAGIVLAASGDKPGGLWFLSASAAQLALNLTTRYSARG